jgi:ferrous iron transport protein B
MDRKLTVALTGNPNSGKTTIFNSLTGFHHHVGNYPGVTVEKREGTCRHGGAELTVVDLPGTYSLTAYSQEEVVARNYIIDDRPDVVVDIIDASNLERNLYLAVQLMELGAPLVLAFNMSDVAEARGYQFDLPKLSSLLGTPIVPTVGHKRQGTEQLLAQAVEVGAGRTQGTRIDIRYGPEIEEELAKIQALLEREGVPGHGNARWVALKLLEDDSDVRKRVNSEAVLSQVRQSLAHLQGIFGDSPEFIIADRRYGFISGACQETVRSTVEARHTMSDRIDAVVTGPALGLPIFLVLMYFVFHLTFTLGGPPMQWIESLFGWLSRIITACWAPGAESLLKSLLVDGIIGGVGGVIAFLPNILLLFLAIAVLEDSGYMARAAFIMDTLMHRIGLHGKSFIPMLIGFGCSVPAIMATRTLESRRDRLTTMLVLPLFSCGARLPIYALIIPAFFHESLYAPMLMAIYLIGILLAIVSARLARWTLFPGESTPFVMELPPYRIPTIRGALIHTWERGGLYLRKAGTVILGISVLLWALTSYPKRESFAEGEALTRESRQAAELSHSYAGRIGHAIEPILKPMGFDWRIGTALIGAFAAKEVFVAQMAIVFAVGDTSEDPAALRTRLRSAYSPLVGFCIMLFCLVAAPCMATIAMTRAESGSWRWAALQWGGLTAAGYVLTTIVYQLGRLLGIG